MNGHFYAHHQELETICALLRPMVCSAWGWLSGVSARQQATLQNDGSCTTLYACATMHGQTHIKFRGITVQLNVNCSSENGNHKTENIRIGNKLFSGPPISVHCLCVNRLENRAGEAATKHERVYRDNACCKMPEWHLTEKVGMILRCRFTTNAETMRLYAVIPTPRTLGKFLYASNIIRESTKWKAQLCICYVELNEKLCAVDYRVKEHWEKRMRLGNL